MHTSTHASPSIDTHTQEPHTYTHLLHHIFICCLCSFWPKVLMRYFTLMALCCECSVMLSCCDGCVDSLCLRAQTNDLERISGYAQLLRWLRGWLVPVCSDTGWGDVRQ